MAKDSKYMEKEIKDAVSKVKAEHKDEKSGADEKQKKADPAQEKIAELTNDLQRLQAEFENYKKRTEKECASFREYAKAELVKKLLTILDSFEMAFKNSDNHEEFIKGVELIYSQLFTILKDEGLQPIDCQGRKLDPNLHDVMLTEKSDKEEDTVLEELQKGYKLKGMVIRHSKVKVAK